MKTKQFYPQLSVEPVNMTMQTLDASTYPETIFNKKIQMEKKELRDRIIGMLILTPLVFSLGIALIVNVFLSGLPGINFIGGILFPVIALLLIVVIPPTKKRNESIRSVISRFYSSLCIESKTGDFKTYLVLAPNTMLQVSEDEFKKIWDEFDKNIEVEVKNQESAVCTECEQKFRGLRAVSKYWFKDDYLKGHLILLSCPKCESVFCSKCYVNLKNRHTCTKCGKKMKEIVPKMFQDGLSVFMPNPELIKKANISDIKIDQKSDNSADILCEVTYNYKYEDIVKSSSGSTTRQIELGNRGKVICQFKNKAIKIGDEWRLTAANPGTLQSD